MIFFIVFIAIIAVVMLILDFIKPGNIYIKKVFKYFIISAGITAFLEIFIFNFEFFHSLIYNEKNNVEFSIEEGIKKDENGYEKSEEVTESGKRYIEIKDINDSVKNIHLSIDNSALVPIKISFTDDSNKIYFTAGIHNYVQNIEKSHYIKVNASGKVKSIKLELMNNFEPSEISEISLNRHVPLFIELNRILIMLFLIFFIICVLPKSKLHEIKFDNKVTIIVSIFIVILISFTTFKLVEMDKFYNLSTDKTNPESQYRDLAESLLKGKVSLELDVSDKLLALENPYDTNYRDEVLEKNKDYYWDFSYYNGKYYSYFGILPCLLFYIPHYLIFNSHVDNVAVLEICLCLMMVSTFYIIYQICKKKFNYVSMPIYILISIFTFLASGGIHAIRAPEFYNIPIVLALALAMFGIGLWIKASMDNSKFKKWYLMLGSLFIALIATCRPNLLIVAFLAIPLFANDMFKQRTLFSKKSLKETIMFIAPFIIIAILQMLYNYLRFDSVLEFGAKYNFTSYDMTKFGFNINRIPQGIFSYLFEIPNISFVYPFLKGYIVQTDYLGKVIGEIMYGGYLFQNLICILAFVPFIFKSILKEKKLYIYNILLIIFGLILLVIDIEMGGIRCRYFLDFGFTFTFSTVLIILSLLEKYKNRELQYLIIIFIIIGVLVNMLMYISNNTLYVNNGYLMYYLQNTFCFWI